MTFGLAEMSRYLFIQREKKYKESPYQEYREMPKSLCDGMIAALVCGKKVRLERLGVIEIKQVKSRSRRNPQTGETFQAPARMGVKFKPSDKLIDLLNSKKKKSKKLRASCQVVQGKLV